MAKKSGSKKAAAKRSKPKKWSKKVTERSNALDLRSKIFTKDDPHAIALSLKRSAERSKRKKGTPYQAAMSMLNFYIIRAWQKLAGEATTNIGKSERRA